MRRNWRALALAAFLLILLGLALASVRALSRLESPAAEIAAGALSRILDRPVEIGHAELRFGLTLGIEVYDLRVLEPEGTPPGPDGEPLPPTLEVRYARGEQSWPRVLVGQVVPLNWDIASPTLRIHTGTAGEATLTPPELPALNVDLRDGRVEWVRANGDMLVVDVLTLSARRSAFGLAMHGSAKGRLSRDQRTVSRFDMRVEGLPTDFSLKGAVSGLELAELPTGVVDAQGVGKGEIELSVRREALEARIALTFAGLEIALPEFKDPLVPETNRLTLDVGYRDGALSLELHRVELDDLIASGHLRYWTGARPHVSANLGFEAFEPASSRTRLQPLRLLGLRYETWMRIGERIRAGRVEDLSIRFDAPVTRLRDIFAFADHVRSEELQIELSARDGVYVPSPGSPPLEQIEADVAIRGNVLRVSDLEMQREGDALPRIDLLVEGMHRLVRLPEEERGTPDGPGTPIPGLEAAAAVAQGSEAPDREDTVVRFSDAEVHYPAFIFPVRDASGVLRFPSGRLVLQEASAVVGGAPAELAAQWDTRASTIDVHLVYLDHEVPTRRTPPRDWLRGRIESGEIWFGEWRVGDLEADVNVHGADVRARNLRGRMLGGDLTGSGALSLAQVDKAAFEFDLTLVEGEAAALEPHLGLPSDSLSGSLSGRGRLAGALDAQRDFLEHWDIELALELREGSVGNLPPAVVLARLPSLRGVRGLLGRDLPYDTVDTVITIKGGELQVADFRLIGPELRILASGEVDLASDDFQTDMIVSVLFLRTLDKVLGALPIVRDIVLGPDKNLLAAYFRLSGPWADMSAAILAPKAVENVFDLLSGAIRGSVNQLRRIIPGGGDGGAGSEEGNGASP